MQPLLSFLYQTPVALQTGPLVHSDHPSAMITLSGQAGSLCFSPWADSDVPSTCAYFSLLARVASFITAHPQLFNEYRITHHLSSPLSQSKSIELWVSTITGIQLGYWRIHLDRRSDELPHSVTDSKSALVEWTRCDLVAFLNHEGAITDYGLIERGGGLVYRVELAPNAITIKMKLEEQNMHDNDYVPLRMVLGHLEVKKLEFLSLREGSCLQTELPEQFEVDVQIGERSWCTAQAKFVAGKLQIELTKWAENIFHKKPLSQATTNENLRLNEKLSDLEEAA
jgi:hypothetical protein